MHLCSLAIFHLVHYVFVHCFLSPVMAEQKKFSLAKAVAGNKRSSEAPPQSAGKKVPKVSELKPVEARPQRAVTNAPVVICVYPVRICDTHTWTPSNVNQNCCVCFLVVQAFGEGSRGSQGISHSR